MGARRLRGPVKCRACWALAVSSEARSRYRADAEAAGLRGLRRVPKEASMMGPFVISAALWFAFVGVIAQGVAALMCA